MTTEEAFKKMIHTQDSIKRTSMTLCKRAQFRAYFDGKAPNRKPKRETMEKYLKEYGFKKQPEKWVLKKTVSITVQYIGESDNLPC